MMRNSPGKKANPVLELTIKKQPITKTTVKNMELSLLQIAREIDGQVVGDENKMISGAAGFESAGKDHITYAGSPGYLNRINETRAGAVLVPRGFDNAAINLVVVENPRVAFTRISEIFYPRSKPAAGIHSSCCIGENFIHGTEVSIGPFVVVGKDVIVGCRVVLHPHVVIGDGVCIGNDVEIFPNVTVLQRCVIGDRVIIHSGSVIGSDGFGFEPCGEKYIKIHHTGIVQIDNDVEIGACNTIDRGTNGKTWIKDGVKTDNLVHIGHNVMVGENTIIVAQVGVSGSVIIGKHVVLAGQAGIAGHLVIDDNAVVGPKAGIVKSVSAGDVLSGTPGMPHKLWLRVHRVLPMLPDLKKRIEKLEKRLASDN
jgi:UDP-3-O-[3-hydroxymyristoyl] glucosamine N-acyltransferase